MERMRPHKNVRRCALFLLATLLAGCGDGLKEADPNLAKQALVAVLDAWHEGRSIDDVSNGPPVMTVSDPAWKGGYKLSKYEVAEATQTAGFDRTIPVELWLQDPRGKAVRQKVRYTVSLEPTRTVLRSPL